MKITKPGVYSISEAEYHADPCPEPSLSKSVGHTLLTRSPRHAWLQHPRLNPDYEPEVRATFDLGSAAHSMMLNSDAGLSVIEADDWRTKAAKAARDEAREAGLIPLLQKDYDKTALMVNAGRVQIVRHEDAGDAFKDGKPEQALVWKEGDVWCRCLLDWLPDDPTHRWYDYKTTDASAAPQDWGKRIAFDTGCDLQVAFYRRGIRAIFGIENPAFAFVVQERKPPYALCVIELDRHTVEFADKKALEAIRRFGWCLENDFWPGYPRRTVTVDTPPWKEAEWLAEENRMEIAKEQGEDLLALSMKMQEPL